MKGFLLLFLSAMAFAQTSSVFPGRAVSQAELMVPASPAPVGLAAAVGAADTSIAVSGAFSLTTPALVTIEREVLSICAASSSVLTVGTASACPSSSGRGFFGSRATTHASGSTVQGNFSISAQNEFASELIAVQQRALKTIYVTDKGAKGDGVSDDTLAIATAIAAAGPGGVVNFPAGTYMATQINLTSSVLLTGVGNSTVLQQKAGTTGAFIVANYPMNQTLGSAGLQSLVVNGSGNATATIGLQLGSSVVASGSGAVGFGVEHVKISAFGTGVLYMGNTRLTRFTHSALVDNGQQLSIPVSPVNTGDTLIFDGDIFGVNATGAFQSNCVNVQSGLSVRISNSSFDGCQLVNGTSTLSLTNVHFGSPNGPLSGDYIVNTGNLSIDNGLFLVANGVNGVTELISSGGSTSYLSLRSVLANSTTGTIPALATVANGGTVKETNTLGITNISTLVANDASCAAKPCNVQVTSGDAPGASGQLVSSTAPRTTIADTTQAAPLGVFQWANTGGYYGLYSRSGNNAGFEALLKCKNLYLGSESCSFGGATGIDANSSSSSFRVNQTGEGDLVNAQKNGTTKFRVDNSGNMTVSGLLDGGFTRTETGAVQRTLTSKLNEMVSVKDFGAKGDGVTDDSAALQAAYNSVGVTGGIVTHPCGTYSFSKTLIKPRNVIATGCGVDTGTTLSYTGTGTAIVDADSNYTQSSPQKERGGWRDLAISGPGASTATIGILQGGDPTGILTPSYYGGQLEELHNVTIRNFGVGWQLGNHAYDVDCRGCRFDTNGYGFSAPAGTTDSGITIDFTSCLWVNNQIGAQYLNNNFFIGKYVNPRWEYTGTAFVFANSADLHIINPNFEVFGLSGPGPSFGPFTTTTNNGAWIKMQIIGGYANFAGSATTLPAYTAMDDHMFEFTNVGKLSLSVDSMMVIAGHPVKNAFLLNPVDKYASAASFRLIGDEPHLIQTPYNENAGIIFDYKTTENDANGVRGAHFVGRTGASEMLSTTFLAAGTTSDVNPGENFSVLTSTSGLSNRGTIGFGKNGCWQIIHDAWVDKSNKLALYDSCHYVTVAMFDPANDSTLFPKDVVLGGNLNLAPVSVSSLPACTSSTFGYQRVVSDSTTQVWGATISGGGSLHAGAFCDGASWTVYAK